MEKLIVIKGDPNSGKTTAIRCLLNVLFCDGAQLFPCEYSNLDFKGDFNVMLEYKGKRVVLCSGGDLLREVLGNVSTYAGKCDVLIIASRHFALDRHLGEYNMHICEKERYDDYQKLIDFVKGIIVTLL